MVEHAKHDAQPQLIRRRTQVFPSTSDHNAQCLGKTPSALGHQTHWQSSYQTQTMVIDKLNGQPWTSRPWWVQPRARVSINDGVRHGLHSYTFKLQAAQLNILAAGAHHVRVHEISRVVRAVHTVDYRRLSRWKAKTGSSPASTEMQLMPNANSDESAERLPDQTCQPTAKV